MKRTLFGILSTLLFLGARADQNGGKSCAGCTVVLGLVEQTAQIHAVSVTQAIS